VGTLLAQLVIREGALDLLESTGVSILFRKDLDSNQNLRKIIVARAFTGLSTGSGALLGFRGRLV
jgi:hypothetical protein